MLSMSNVSAAQAENYYDKDDYYTQDLQPSQPRPSSQWTGKGAATLGLTSDVTKSTFQTLLQGETPGGQSLHARKIDLTKHRAATDYTFSAPKSVSIAALIQKDKRVIQAHDAALKTALEVLENRYAQTRVRHGPGIREKVSTGNIIAATAQVKHRDHVRTQQQAMLAGVNAALESVELEQKPRQESCTKPLRRVSSTSRVWL